MSRKCVIGGVILGLCVIVGSLFYYRFNSMSTQPREPRQLDVANVVKEELPQSELEAAVAQAVLPQNVASAGVSAAIDPQSAGGVPERSHGPGAVDSPSIADLLEGVDMTDPKARARIVRQIKEKELSERQMVLDKAARLGLPVRVEQPDGSVIELMGFNGDEPIYRTTHNHSAAISSGASTIRVAPYGLSGNGISVGVWDGGSVRSSHQELIGHTSLQNSGAQLSNHATHVAGTIGAVGVRSNAKGMAPEAQILSYDWNSDLSEMLSVGAAAASGAGSVSISNHSYGIVVGYSYDGSYWRWYGDGTSSGSVEEDFGRYTSQTRDWDAVANQLPYLTMFKAAGNDRNDTPSSGSSVYSPSGSFLYSYSSGSRPGGDGDYRNGYECQGFAALAKNVITVGAVTDAVSGGSRLPGAASMSSFSCWGPTDDGRIKPDLVANGVGVESPVASGDASYDTYQGTSMATPSAAGSAALLAELYHSEFSVGYMPASLMKALLIHTADDLGAAGPDYQNGWGLINVHRAADLLLAHKASPSSPKLFEESLTVGARTFTHEFDWDGVSSIRATLCWNDPAGLVQAQHDSRSPTLVHNLDLKVTAPNGQVSLPYVMPFVGNWTVGSMASAAINAKNNVDNVEQVYLPAPSQPGRYSVTVSLDGSLTKSQQLFSLIVTGAQSTGSDESRLIRLSGDLSYGAVEVGQVTSRNLLIENLGNSPLTVTGITLPTGFSGSWSGVLAAGGSQSVVVRFSPTVTGAYGGSVRVGSDATSGGNTVVLSGSGVAGNTIVALSNGQSVSGLSGAASSVRYYQVAVPSGQSALRFEMSGSGDADLYVRFGSLPTVNDWDYRPYSGGSDEVVAVDGPQMGVWYVMIRGYSEYSGLALTASYEGAAISRIIELQGDLDFGNIPVGDTVLRNVSIRNVGTSELSVSGLSMPSGFSGSWSGVIAPGAQQQVEIVFSPTVEQVYLGALTVLSNKTSGANSLSMSGTGVITQITLQNGAQVGPFSGFQGSQSFFFIDVPSGQASLDLQLQGGSGNADLYVKYGARPSLSSFDYRTNDGASDDVLSIASPQAGRWFILLNAETQFTDVRLTAEYEAAVVNTRIIRLTGDLDFGEVRVNGSESRELVIHNDGTVPLAVTGLQYSSGYSGAWSGLIQAGGERSITVLFQPTVAGVNTGSVSVLSNATSGPSTATLHGTGLADDASFEMENGVPLTGLVGLVDSERRFQIELPENVTLFSVSISGSVGDVDLYLRQGTPPTLSEYDYRPYISGSDESVVVQSPASGTWYILLHGYTEYSGLSILATYSVGGASEAEFSNPTSIILPDSGAGSLYPSTINVSGLGSDTESVKVALHGISHTYPSDLDILLVGPEGESIVLMSDAGGSNDLVDVSLDFDDDSSQALAASSQLVSGVYRPTNHYTGYTEDFFPEPAPSTTHGLALDVFSGTDPNGTWSLYVVDDAGGDRGAIAGGWSLVIETQGSALPPNLTDGSGTHTLNPSQVDRGDTMSFSVDIANNGGVASGAFTVRLQFSADDVFSDEVTTVADVSMASINPGEVVQLDTTFTVPGSLEPGNYYLGWQIDAFNDVLESDEGDNSWYRTTPVSVSGGAADDHGGSTGTATAVHPTSSTVGTIGFSGDDDYFRVVLASSGVLQVYTSGSTDTYGYLLNAGGTEIASNDDDGDGLNFLLDEALPAGTYYILVQGFDANEMGPYRLETVFASDSGFAPSVGTVVDRLPGQAFNGSTFTDATRFDWNEYSGNWSYAQSAPNAGVLTQTYDVFDNDPNVYREETLLTFLTTTSGTYVYREYEYGSPVYEEVGNFDFPWLAGPPIWEPQGWVYFNWPYAYSFAEGRWHFFNTSDRQWRVDLSNGVWGELADATGWNYYNWPYSYSTDESTWHWYNADTQWVVDLISGVWARLGDSGD